MPQRINVPLTEEEATALVSMSKMECRHPREQARYILRQELSKRGYLVEHRNAETRSKEAQGAGAK